MNPEASQLGVFLIQRAKCRIPVRHCRRSVRRRVLDVRQNVLHGMPGKLALVADGQSGQIRWLFLESRSGWPVAFRRGSVAGRAIRDIHRSEEHTSELQSPMYL